MIMRLKQLHISIPLFLIGVAALSFACISYFMFSIVKDLPSPSKLISYDIPQTTKIYDRNGALLYEIFTDQNRTLVKLDRIPETLRRATIAIEDKDFYKHQGINPVGGMLRAAKETLLRKKLQGGSTITQQLVKTALLSNERTVIRKLKEIVLAFWTERLYNKDQILEMYFNQVPYGGTFWGIEAASLNYFGKDVKDLTLAQSALLAGLPAAPSIYSPYGTHPELAFDRQKSVLDRMQEDGVISAEEKQKALEEKIVFKPPRTDIKAPHFVMYVKEKLAEKYGEKMVAQGGLKVTTSLDLPLQEFTQDAVASEIGRLKNLSVGNGAALVVRPPTGEILAMVGSKDYFASDSGNFNVTTSLRQPGSSIKPLNYAIGIETRKVTAATMFLDTPTCFAVEGQKNYCPVNYDGKFHGPQQLRFALGNSYNIPAVKMMALNGVDHFIASASALGISSFKDPSQYGLSLTLGGGEVTMLDMAKSFGVLANTGVKKELVSILKVEDRNGKILEEYTDQNFFRETDKPLNYPSSILINGPRVLSGETSFIISHILLDNNARKDMFGSSSMLVIPNKAVSVKTGTTDDKRDNWTIGYTPNFLTVVWVGNNDNSPMNPALTSGVTGAAPIWNTIMKRVLRNQSDLWPKQPEGIIGAQVCNLTGLMPPNQDKNASDKGCGTRYEYFIKDTLPAQRESLKQNIAVDSGTKKAAPPTQKENIEYQEHQVASDMFGLYCLDCNHEGGDPATLVKL